jgi:UDP-4-amino-4,6-dideoxy-N-acetyl-beta-L-altrosamine transaminase
MSDHGIDQPPILPYGRQTIDEDDVAAVVQVLRSAWLTTGPKVADFETAVALRAGTAHAVAFSNGTAALHGIMHAVDIRPGDEVLVPAITFAASANCVVYCGGVPKFVDVEPDTLLIDPDAVEAAITHRTRAILAVDYAGQPCDYQRLEQIAQRHGLLLLADACHSLGATYQERPAGSLALASAFSFHPVKPIATGEGGMVTTHDGRLAARMRTFRNHGIETDHRQREAAGTWYYEMQELGFNYRLSDIQCALGISQLRKLDAWTRRRQEIAAQYQQAFAPLAVVEPLAVRPGVASAYHLFVIRWRSQPGGLQRAEAFARLRSAGLLVNVHYLPVHLHPYYRRQFGTRPGQCPVAEAAYEEIVSLPIYPAMTDGDVARVVSTVAELASTACRRAS